MRSLWFFIKGVSGSLLGLKDSLDTYIFFLRLFREAVNLVQYL